MDKQSEDFKNRLIDEAIAPNADEIARIVAYRDVALVFYDVHPEMQEAARAIGWNGDRLQVKRLSEKQSEKIASSLKATSPSDPAAQWLKSRREGRIFVVAEAGTLCLNISPEEGYYFEPGTLDAGRMN